MATTFAHRDHVLQAPDGARLSARSCGPESGVPVVLIAGWPQTLHAWRAVQAKLADAGIRSIALDPPGLGESDPIGDAANYATPEVARRMAAALASAGVDRFVLVGHDVGAWIAYAWASLMPQGIAGLMLQDAAIPGAFPDGFLSIGNAARVFQFAFNAVPELPERLTRGRERVYLDWLFETKTRVAGAITAEDISVYMRCYGQPERMSAGFNYYRAVPASIDALNDVAPLTMPVLALGAEFGVGAMMGRVLEQRCTDLKSAVVAGSGHFIPEEAPDVVCRELQALLARTSMSG